MSSDKQELRKILSDLALVGFSEHEARTYLALVAGPVATKARTYLALVATGPATAYELAKKANIPVPNTYNVIRALSARGAAVKVSSRPGRYLATPPATLFKSMATQVTNTCESLVTNFEKLEPPSAQDFVEILTQGRKIDDRISELIQGAEEKILLKGPAHLPSGMQSELKAAAKRGVQILYVYYGDMPPVLDGPNVQLWPHEGNGAQFGAVFFAICADYKGALIRSLDEVDDGAYSENKSFVYLTGIFIRHEIYLAEIMRSCGAGVEAEFGPALYKIRRRFGLNPLAPELAAFVRKQLLSQGKSIDDFEALMAEAETDTAANPGRSMRQS